MHLFYLQILSKKHPDHLRRISTQILRLRGPKSFIVVYNEPLHPAVQTAQTVCNEQAANYVAVTTASAYLQNLYVGDKQTD